MTELFFARIWVNVTLGRTEPLTIEILASGTKIFHHTPVTPPLVLLDTSTETVVSSGVRNVSVHLWTHSAVCVKHINIGCECCEPMLITNLRQSCLLSICQKLLGQTQCFSLSEKGAGRVVRRFKAMAGSDMKNADFQSCLFTGRCFHDQGVFQSELLKLIVITAHSR